jgi:hypothetical protein
LRFSGVSWARFVLISASSGSTGASVFAATLVCTGFSDVPTVQPATKNDADMATTMNRYVLLFMRIVSDKVGGS